MVFSTGDADSTVKLWGCDSDSRSMKANRMLVTPVRALTHGAELDKLYVGTDDGVVGVFDLETMNLTGSFQGFGGAVQYVSVCGPHTILAQVRTASSNQPRMCCFHSDDRSCSAA